MGSLKKLNDDWLKTTNYTLKECRFVISEKQSIQPKLNYKVRCSIVINDDGSIKSSKLFSFDQQQHQKQQQNQMEMLLRKSNMENTTTKNMHHQNEKPLLVKKNCKSRLMSKLEKTPPKELVKSPPRLTNDFVQRWKSILQELNQYDDDDFPEEYYDSIQFGKVIQNKSKQHQLKPLKFQKLKTNHLKQQRGKTFYCLNDDDEKDEDENRWKDFAKLFHHKKESEYHHRKSLLAPTISIADYKLLCNPDTKNSNDPMTIQKVFFKDNGKLQKTVDESSKHYFRPLQPQITIPMSFNKCSMHQPEQIHTTTTTLIKPTFSRASTLTIMGNDRPEMPTPSLAAKSPLIQNTSTFDKNNGLNDNIIHSEDPIKVLVFEKTCTIADFFPPNYCHKQRRTKIIKNRWNNCSHCRRPYNKRRCSKYNNNY